MGDNVLVIAQTDRLRIRRLEIGDASYILTLLNSEGFVRNIGDRGVRNIAQAEEYLAAGPIASYKRNGFGIYAIEDLRRAAIGIAGLTRKDWLDEPDLAYALLPSEYNHGYATEACRAVINHAWNDLGFSRLDAVVVPENRQSIRVLEKLGFARTGEATDPRSASRLLRYGLHAG